MSEQEQHLAQIRDIHSGIVRNSPIYEFALSGLTVTEASGPVVRAVLPLTATQVNSKGTLHGSVTATIVDWIGGLCVASASADPASAKRGVSVDIHVSYIGGAKAGHELLIEGKADKVGRTLAFISVELRVREQGASDQGKLVAKGSHTKFVG